MSHIQAVILASVAFVLGIFLLYRAIRNMVRTVKSSHLRLNLKRPDDAWYSRSGFHSTLKLARAEVLAGTPVREIYSNDSYKQLFSHVLTAYESDSILPMLKHANPKIRALACMICIWSTEPYYTRHILDRLREDTDMEVRTMAARAIALRVEHLVATSIALCDVLVTDGTKNPEFASACCVGLIASRDHGMDDELSSEITGKLLNTMNRFAPDIQNIVHRTVERLKSAT